jgi:small conductance mechanosensitive channel
MIGRAVGDRAGTAVVARDTALRLAVGLALAAAALAARAADEPAGEAAAKPVATVAEAITHADAETVDHLKLLVRPLTKEELGEAAALWRDRLKEKVAEIGRMRLATLKGKADPKLEPPPEAAAEIAKLQDQRTVLADQLRVVLDEWEKKGGDAAEFRTYSTAVGGLEVDVKDTATAVTVLKNWVFSEQGGLRWAWNIVKFLAILVAFWLLSRVLANITGQAVARIPGASSLLRSFLVNFVRQATRIIGIVVALSALEVNINPLLALIGGAAFVIGLALQGTLANFAHGLLILMYRPFDVGDVIDAGGVSGIVDSMNMLSTTIRTFDNKMMIVPNSKIGGDTITNASASATRRVDLTFGIGYDDDTDKAQAVLARILDAHPLVLKDPAPTIKLHELADSSVNFVVRPWVKGPDYWTVYWDVIAAVKREFDREGISFPFPQREVHMRPVKG